MPRSLMPVIAFFFLAETAISQNSSIGPSAQAKNEPAVYPIPGCQLLWKQEAEIQTYVQSHPEVNTLGKSSNRAAWNFKVGDTHLWWSTNLVTGKDYQVASTCRAVSEHAYIFTEDSLWTIGKITQAGVDSIRTAFDQRTPASPQKGIYQVDVETFGEPPDVDNDPKIIILILDVKDGFSGSGGYVAGYFYNANEYKDGAIPDHRSNECEIYYLDGYPSNLTNPYDLVNASSVTAHEFQHMIHFNYDPNETTFINESCSETAALVCGYMYTSYWQYLGETDTPLFQWNGTMADYSRAARWGVYLWQQFPQGYLRLLVANKLVGIAGINSSLSQYPSIRTFNDLFVDWLIANYLNDGSVDSRYAYAYPVVGKAKTTVFVNPIVPQTTAGVSRLAADYISFTRGANLTASFTTASADIRIKAIEIGATSKRVIDVSPNSQFSEPLFGSKYTEITVVVLNASQTWDASYSYVARGAAELKWDDSEPQSYVDHSRLDTVCVTFDAVAGARLDSVRVALRRAGTVNGGVWLATGLTRPSPLGKPLAVPISASTTLTSPVTNPGTLVPFGIPYPNWRSIDLRSYDISTDQPFVIGFWFGPDTANDARVMVTRYAGTNPYHSYTYANNPIGSTPGWYYVNAGGGQIFIYHIRAYVSMGRPVVPILVSPADGSSLMPINQTLVWNVSLGATAYHLQVSTSTSFTTNLVDDSTIVGTSRNVGPLPSGTWCYWRVRAKNDAGLSAFSPTWRFQTKVASLVEEKDRTIPEDYELGQNYPNPFNPSTTISYAVPKQANVLLRIFDALGQEIAVLVNELKEPGFYQAGWNAHVASGIYFYRLQAGEFVQTKKMVLLH
jgi:hypothetical protein